MTETINFTEQESCILRDICFARTKVLHAGDTRTPEEVPLQTELSGVAARQALPVFDFFRCAFHGNTEGLKRQVEIQYNRGQHAGCNYYDGMAEDYKTIMTGLMGNQYTPGDVDMLRNRIIGFIKSLKPMPARTLYIADCHFYHRRLNTEMDKRGFASVEEMNAHMIGQWNAKVTKKDTVYILGDFSLAGGFQTSGVLESLNGNKHLIIGNHDEKLINRFIMETRRTMVTSRYSTEPETIPCNMINCFCMFSDYQPMTLDEWIKIDEKRRQREQVRHRISGEISSTL